MLKFRVAGSGGREYTIRAEGSGEALSMRCSCPAGHRGGVFCKHVAALLVGDVTALLDPSDSVDVLTEAARGSPLVERAISHAPKRRHWPADAPPDHIGTALATHAARLEAAGWRIDAVDVDIFAASRPATAPKRRRQSLVFRRHDVLTEPVFFGVDGVGGYYSTDPDHNPTGKTKKKYSVEGAAVRSFDYFNRAEAAFIEEINKDTR